MRYSISSEAPSGASASRLEQSGAELEDLLRRVPQEVGDLLVGVDVAVLVQVVDVDEIGACIEYLRYEALALFEFGFGALAFGDVREQHHEMPRLWPVDRQVELQLECLHIDVELLGHAGRRHPTVRREEVGVGVQVAGDHLGDEPALDVMEPGEPAEGLVDLEVLEIDRRARLVVDHAAGGEALGHRLEEAAVVLLGRAHGDAPPGTSPLTGL
jgi:hypothetical protein